VSLFPIGWTNWGSGTRKNWDQEASALNSWPRRIEGKYALKLHDRKLQRQLEKEEIQTQSLIRSRTPPSQEAPKYFVRDNNLKMVYSKCRMRLPNSLPLSSIEPGLRVIDACARAGGKNAALASLMENKGRHHCPGYEEWKLEELKKRREEAGAGTSKPGWFDSSKVIKRLENSVDRLLLDVPCTGLGVLKRNPDAQVETFTEFFEKVKELQQKILSELHRHAQRAALV